MSGGWIQASVSIPCTASSQSRWRTGVSTAGVGRRVGASHCLEARVPQPVHRLPFVVHAIVQFAQRGQRRSRARRHIGAESRQGLGFFEDPRELLPRGGGNAVQHHGAPEIEPRSDARDILRRARAQLLEEQCFDVSGPNAAGRQLCRDTATRPGYGSRPSRIAACSTASSNGRCSNACSVLW